MTVYETVADDNQRKENKVPVSQEDARMIQKVHTILDAGKNVEIKKDKSGKTKVFKVSKEIT